MSLAKRTDGYFRSQIQITKMMIIDLKRLLSDEETDQNTELSRAFRKVFKQLNLINDLNSHFEK
jgi:hypothetical protein